MKRVSAPPALIANHLLRVDPAGDPETVSVLRQAAVLAASGGDSRSTTHADAACAGGAAPRIS